MDSEAGTILVADDEQSVRWVLARALEDSGYRVVQAEGGNDALAKLRDGPLDLAFIDIRMPDLDGLAVLASAKEGGVATPIIIVTGEYDDYEGEKIAWSNELVLHVIELKTNGPAPSLDPLPELFQSDVRRINSILRSRDARLMPTAMHPWMDPATETRLWPPMTSSRSARVIPFCSNMKVTASCGVTAFIGERSSS